jgi:hypothetical protein
MVVTVRVREECDQYAGVITEVGRRRSIITMLLCSAVFLHVPELFDTYLHVRRQAVRNNICRLQTC